ncbi:MAG: MarR family winged helix-turn-helix transcriptional regulator [Pigmentiphaga sp.]
MADPAVPPDAPMSGAAFVDDYLLALLAQASQLVSNEFHQVVMEHGLSVSEWRVMSSLAGGKPISIGGLALLSVTKQPTVTRLLERMILKGHVERVTHSGDRRVNLVCITPQGQEMVAALMIKAKEHEARVFEPFGGERTEILKSMLRDIIAQHRPG